MLEFKVIENLKPNKDLTNLLKDFKYKVKLGQIKIDKSFSKFLCTYNQNNSMCFLSYTYYYLFYFILSFSPTYILFAFLILFKETNFATVVLYFFDILIKVSPFFTM